MFDQQSGIKEIFTSGFFGNPDRVMWLRFTDENYPIMSLPLQGYMDDYQLVYPYFVDSWLKDLKFERTLRQERDYRYPSKVNIDEDSITLEDRWKVIDWLLTVIVLLTVVEC